MQRAITLKYKGLTLRGMEHFPEPSNSEQKVPAAILFHGFTGNKLEGHRMFLKICRALENQGVASFRFDFSGSGESDGNFEDMTLWGEVEEARAILDFVQSDERVDTSKIYLIGLSMGGLVTSLLAGQRPQDVNRIVLMAPAGNMGDIVLHIANTMGAEIQGDVVDHGGNLVGVRLVNDFRDGFNPFELAKTFQGDVLLIHGTEDATVPSQVSQMYVQRTYGERATLRLIEGADHTFNKHEWERQLIEDICVFLR